MKELERRLAQQVAEVRLQQLQRQEHDKEKESLLQRTQAAELSERQASAKLETAETLTKDLQAKMTAKDVKISALERAKTSEREKAEKAQEDLKQFKRDALHEQGQVEEEHKRQMAQLQIQLDQAHADVAASKKQIGGLEDEVYAEKKRADGLKNSLAAAEKTRDKAEAHNATLTEQTSKLSQELSEQGKQLREQESKLEKAQADLVAEKEAAGDARRESEQVRRKNRTFREDFPDKLKRISEMMIGFVTEYNEVVDGNGGLGSLVESQRCVGGRARSAAHGGGVGRSALKWGRREHKGQIVAAAAAAAAAAQTAPMPSGKPKFTASGSPLIPGKNHTAWGVGGLLLMQPWQIATEKALRPCSSSGNQVKRRSWTQRLTAA